MANSNHGLFAGAGVIVCNPGGAKRVGSAVVVETKHAAQISELIFALKEIFAPEIDYFNKYAFYGRLAAGANNQIRHGDDLVGLRSAIIREACVLAAEVNAHLYFAYGSNMDDIQMQYRCPEAIFAGTATLRDYAFELDSAGVATVVENSESSVYGALWLISKSDEASLDYYEGVSSGCYRKATCQIIDNSDNSLPALVYISNREEHDGITYREGYMERIVANAKRLGIKNSYVEMLETK